MAWSRWKPVPNAQKTRYCSDAQGRLLVLQVTGLCAEYGWWLWTGAKFRTGWAGTSDRRRAGRNAKRIVSRLEGA